MVADYHKCTPGLGLPPAVGGVYCPLLPLPGWTNMMPFLALNAANWTVRFGMHSRENVWVSEVPKVDSFKGSKNFFFITDKDVLVN